MYSLIKHPAIHVLSQTKVWFVFMAGCECVHVCFCMSLDMCACFSSWAFCLVCLFALCCVCVVCLCCVFIVLVFAHTAVNTAPVLTSWHLHNVSRWLCQPPVTTVSAQRATRAWGDDCDYFSWLLQFWFWQYWWCLWATMSFSSSYTTECAFVTLAILNL